MEIKKQIGLFVIFAAIGAAQALSPVADFSSTVSGLPSASTYANKRVLITDGASTCDVSTGGGSTRVLAVSNGTAWIAPNCGGSGGGFDTADCQVLTASGGTFTVPASTTTGCFGISFTTTANVSMPTPVTGSSRKIILTYTNVTPTTGSPITYTGATSSGLAQPVSPSANAITTVTAYWNATTSSWGPQAAGTTPSCGGALSAGQIGAAQSSGCTAAATAANVVGLFSGGHSSSSYGLATDGSQQLFGSGGSISGGAFSALPSCPGTTAYVVQSGYFGTSVCSGSTWTHVLAGGAAITPASSLSLSTIVLQTGVTVSSTNGAEVMSFGAGGTNAQSLRYWAAPTAPYTSNLVMIPTTIIDDPNTTYRGFSFGFGDASGNSEVFDCEVGQTSPSGLWCRVTTWNSSGTYTAQPMPTFSAAATSLAFPPWQTPSVLYAHLKDDSTNIYFGISKDGKNPIWIFSEGRTAHIGTPTRLVYGGINSAPTYTATVSLVGVLQ